MDREEGEEGNMENGVWKGKMNRGDGIWNRENGAEDDSFKDYYQNEGEKMNNSKHLN